MKHFTMLNKNGPLRFPFFIALNIILSVYSVRNITENNIIKDLSGSSVVWIGLHRQKVWSDGSQSVFQYPILGQNSVGELCVSADRSGQWSNNYCSSQFPFICYKIGMYVQVLP